METHVAVVAFSASVRRGAIEKFRPASHVAAVAVNPPVLAGSVFL
jgi:hypothetical protein